VKPIEVFEIERTVTEADGLGHANNVIYVQWMQDAAVGHSAALGLTPEAYVQLGAAFVVRRHEIDYRRQAAIGSRVRIETWVATFERVRSRRCYRFTDIASGEELARATTDWAFIDLATGRPTRIPHDVRNRFTVHAGPFDSA
jgi:acyl-CoA thioester hydrolase